MVTILFKNHPLELPPQAVQWLGLYIFTAEGSSPIPAQGTEIPQATASQKHTNIIQTPYHQLLSPDRRTVQLAAPSQ